MLIAFQYGAMMHNYLLYTNNKKAVTYNMHF